MLSKGAKRTIFYHIAVILQYCWDKTITRSGDMYRDHLGIHVFTLVIKCYLTRGVVLCNYSIENNRWDSKEWVKQNRESTEGYSKSIVLENNDVWKKVWSQQVKHMQVRKGRGQVSGGVSVPCRHDTPAANVLWKPLNIR